MPRFNYELWKAGQKVEDNLKPKIDKFFDADFKRNDDIFNYIIIRFVIVKRSYNSRIRNSKNGSCNIRNSTPKITIFSCWLKFSKLEQIYMISTNIIIQKIGF